ncbi:hypothetical protein GALMADRAFT_921405 [Galerina marginata CBS 339.88]|uniref:Uncharacterized protein n=1 Tax=Galerina marginata (strain CBS 339.88) TaxID=685588 RepID=A0A067SHK5_GALM3|nr:hypothetical protein GALMADRAFT_921405 [Galerina marginata CBS 339.88]
MPSNLVVAWTGGEGWREYRDGREGREGGREGRKEGRNTGTEGSGERKGRAERMGGSGGRDGLLCHTVGGLKKERGGRHGRHPNSTTLAQVVHPRTGWERRRQSVTGPGLPSSHRWGRKAGTSRWINEGKAMGMTSSDVRFFWVAGARMKLGYAVEWREWVDENTTH